MDTVNQMAPRLGCDGGVEEQCGLGKRLPMYKIRDNDDETTSKICKICTLESQSDPNNEGIYNAFKQGQWFFPSDPMFDNQGDPVKSACNKKHPHESFGQICPCSK